MLHVESESVERPLAPNFAPMIQPRARKENISLQSNTMLSGDNEIMFYDARSIRRSVSRRIYGVHFSTTKSADNTFRQRLKSRFT